MTVPYYRRSLQIGDAAHSVHPLAGQGLNLGIGDADELAEVLAWGARIGCDPGSPAVLARYDGARRPHNAVMGGALDAIGRVFDARALGGVTPIWASEPLALARNMGMAALNNVTLLAPLKSAMQGFAMGTSRL
jgi:2-polyprenyl-6-methoxyphenol hydroxylase-like FAD-dependent oxidoreductase